MTEIVNIGGEDRQVNLGRNALREFEKITGKSILNPGSLVSYEATQVLWFVGLKWGQYKVGSGIEPSPKFQTDAGVKPLTLEIVGEWLDNENGLDAKIFDIFNKSFPKKADAAEKAAE